MRRKRQLSKSISGKSRHDVASGSGMNNVSSVLSNRTECEGVLNLS